MLDLIRITQSNDSRLEDLICLYQDAFPEEERRETAQLKKLIETEENMLMHAVEYDGELAGLCIFWNFGNFTYLEHLAVFPHLRNKKIGQQILNWIETSVPGLRLLEVEPADNEMASRRIGYYERNGYKILNRDYIQPSYKSAEDACTLWIMGNQESGDLETHIEQIKKHVYRNPQNLKI